MNDFSQDPSSESRFRHESEYRDLRRLLLGVEQEQLEEIHRRLGDSQERIRDVGEALPDAILKCSKEGDRLSQAIQPSVEQALKQSVERNPTTLADLLFPIMVPSIRRAITSALREMIQSLNQTLEKTFSLQGLKWRLEAYRTGKTVGEIALLRGLVYRIEQIFLIHRETGIALQHILQSDLEKLDSDMTASMLTAINDYAQDSFQLTDENRLHSLELGDLTIWVEEGSLAYMAVVIRGNAPLNIRPRFQDVLEEFQRTFRASLMDFDGDPSHFDSISLTLQSCLTEMRQSKERSGRPYLVYALAGVMALLLGYWTYSAFSHRHQLSKRLEYLASLPGVIVTQVEKNQGRYVITGLRDPLAAALDRSREPGGNDGAVFQEVWTPYYSLHPDFVLQRAVRILEPPEEIEFSFESGVLAASGSASSTWLERVKRMAALIPGVERLDAKGCAVMEEPFDRLIRRIEETPGYSIVRAEREAGRYVLSGFKDDFARDIQDILGDEEWRSDDLEMKWTPYQSPHPAMLLKRIRHILNPPIRVDLNIQQGVLTLSGTAPDRWIKQFLTSKEALLLLDGIEAIRHEALQAEEAAALQALIQRVEEAVLLFEKGFFMLTANQERTFEELVDRLREIVQISQEIGEDVLIEIVGHTDAAGTQEANLTLSQKRANFIREKMIEQQIDPVFMKAKGVGSLEPVRADGRKENSAMNRSVTFQIIQNERIESGE